MLVYQRVIGWQGRRIFVHQQDGELNSVSCGALCSAFWCWWQYRSTGCQDDTFKAHTDGHAYGDKLLKLHLSVRGSCSFLFFFFVDSLVDHVSFFFFIRTSFQASVTPLKTNMSP